MAINELTDKILNEYKVNKQEIIELLNVNLEELSLYSQKIREKFCKNNFDICSIINGKSGNCSENCKFCAQSIYHKTNINHYSMLDTNQILQEAKLVSNKGVLRFSVVTSGRALTNQDINNLCETFKQIKEQCKILLCASCGLLTYEQLLKLKQAGLTRYHCNLESSKNFFKNICTTHTYEDKLKTISYAKKAGIEVCSGGIIGLGETIQDRIDLFFELRELNIKSVPINVLNPIKNTPLENNIPLTQDEVCRTVALARFILPNAYLRLAGGRALFKDKGKKIFSYGANAVITGDMLTTSGITIAEDLKIIKELGFKINEL